MRILNMLAVLILVFSAQLSFAAGEAYTFTYQAYVTDTSDAPLASVGGVSVRFQIYNPAGNCLLYEETQTGLSTDSKAMLSVRVGSATGDPKRGGGLGDPGLTMSNVYLNNITNRGPGANCAGGYTSSVGDGRVLRVTVNGSVLAPDAILSSVPRATIAENAEALSGIAASGFIQVSGGVTQANMSTLTGGGDASALHNHNSLYANLGSSNNFAGNNLTNIGSVGIGTAAPAGDLEIAKNAATSLRLNSTSAVGNAMSIDFYNGGTNRASIQSRDNSSSLYFYTGGSQALQLTNTQGAVFAGSASFGGTIGPGQYTGGTEPALLAALGGMGAAAKGYMWTNTTTSKLRYWDGAAAQDIASSTGTITSVTAGTGMTNSGTASDPVLNVTYGTAANTALQGNTAFGGDVSGTSGAISVDKIKGITVNTGGIIAGQVLSYNGANFVPATMGTGDFMKNGSVAATGNFDLNTHRISNLMDGAAAQDAATFGQVGSMITAATSGVYVRANGTTALTADWDIDGAGAGTIKLTGLATPTAADGAATKNYVDSGFATTASLANYLPSDGSGAMTGNLKFVSWTTGGRPACAVAGDAGKTGFNTTTGYLETCQGASGIWVDYSNGAGGAALGSANIFTTGLQLIQTGLDTNVGLAVRANSGTQSADLQQWQNSAGTTISSVDSKGRFAVNQTSTAAGPGLQVWGLKAVMSGGNTSAAAGDMGAAIVGDITGANTQNAAVVGFNHNTNASTVGVYGETFNAGIAMMAQVNNGAAASAQGLQVSGNSTTTTAPLAGFNNQGLGTVANFNVNNVGNNNPVVTINGNGTGDFLNIGAGQVKVTKDYALVTRAGGAAAGQAPLYIPSGALLGAQASGAIENDGTNLYYTDSGNTRRTIATTSTLGNYLPLAGGTMAGAASVTWNAGAGSFNMSSATGAFQTSTGANTLNGNVTIAGANTFSTGTGAVALNGNVTIAANRNLTMTAGTGTFSTGTGAISLNGATTIAANQNLTMAAGTGAFSTGTGAVSLNGPTTIAANQNLTMAAGTGAFSTGTGAVTLNGNTTVSGANTFSTGTGAVALNGATTIAANRNLTMTAGTGVLQLNGNFINGSTAANGNLNLDSTSNATKGYILLNAGGGNVGIGTSTPGVKLDVVGGSIRSDMNLQVNFTGMNNNLVIGNNGGGQAFALGTWNGGYGRLDLGDAAITNRIRLDSAPGMNSYFNNGGNVGIGTSTPGAKLEVSGTFKLVDGTQGVGKVLTSDASGNATWQSNGRAWARSFSPVALSLSAFNCTSATTVLTAAITTSGSGPVMISANVPVGVATVNKSVRLCIFIDGADTNYWNDSYFTNTSDYRNLAGLWMGTLAGGPHTIDIKMVTDSTAGATVSIGSRDRVLLVWE